MPHEIIHTGTIARWLPEDPVIIQKYHHDLLHGLVESGIFSESDGVDEKQLSLVILEFKKVIEENAEIFRDFNEMFDQVPPNKNSTHRKIKNYLELLAILDGITSVAPTYNAKTNPLISAVPMYGVIAPFCNTEAGYRAFTNPKVNAMFHRLFDEWARFLVSPASRNVLVDTEGGWFSKEVLEAQDERLGMPFTEAWVCHPEWPHMGFTSWDDFFVRRFREDVRPTFLPDKAEFINNPCEATITRVVSGAQMMDEFWLKDTPYSLDHVLNYDPLATQFANGTVYQAILSSLDYHRWHSPVDGRVVKTCVVPGTYYAARVDDIHDDIDVITRSAAFVTTMTTRALIFIESDNPRIGLMCFVGVGLVEVSTTQIAVREGERIKKGDEIGSFHFGGSTHLLIFRPETKLTLLDDTEPNATDDSVRKVGRLLFRVDDVA